MNAGIAPITSEAITPAKMASTSNAAPRVRKTETRVAGAALARQRRSFGDAAHLFCKGDVGHGSLRAPVLDEIVGQPKSRPKEVTETHPTGVARKDHHSFAKLL